MSAQEEECPVDDSLLGELYRSSPQGLHALVETLPPRLRAMLALYCYRRSHLSQLALAIASTCERQEMVLVGGELGSVVHSQARKPPVIAPEKRRKITLSNGTAFAYAISQDLI